MKRWSYRQITECAKLEIISCHRLSAQSQELRALYRNFALGVFYGWIRLTQGCQEEGDVKRLLALAESNSFPDAANGLPTAAALSVLHPSIPNRMQEVRRAVNFGPDTARPLEFSTNLSQLEPMERV